MNNDLTLLQEKIPTLRVDAEQMRSFLDFQIFIKKNLDLHEVFMFPFAPADGEQLSKSLKNIVDLCKGKSLEKRNQMSDWTKRPLRDEQMHT